MDTLIFTFSKSSLQDFRCDRLADTCIMSSVHEYFGFDNWDQTLLLANRCISSESMGIGRKASITGQFTIDFDYGTPLCETSTHGEIFRTSLSKPIKAFCNFLSIVTSKFLGTSINLYSRQNITRTQVVRNRGAIIHVLTNGFIIENDTANRILTARSRKQIRTICTTGFST